MGVFRALLILFAIAVAICVVLFFVYNDRRFLRWAALLFKVALVAGLLFFAGLMLDRIL